MPPFDLMAVLAKIATLLALALGLGFFVRSIVEYLIKPVVQLLWKDTNHQGRAILIKYIAFGFGALAAWFANFDLFTPLFAEFGVVPYALWGRVATAVLVGGGPTLIHMWIEAWAGETLGTTGVERPPPLEYAELDT